ncbi:hypothetical protein [Acinetobacter pollinis]|jgi:hypothetical protein|uniref:hypothetical protein n=1 Tax=Acinetobacter pollinis TaxID=2605270 RepID=UPI0018A2520C|nr:hypothetical protein [Acinetobacter pollinis]MBF7689468.1 hypothetical protein [Acinetobacter pollinis]MBF7692114.1 hypothetical protein [Acinetobacter pollinis]MBF7696937.1 hypothetical protein [Acinetobacter pollinis]MBF7700329.1 hypothetical protein [Acinetobacter pollinis]
MILKETHVIKEWSQTIQWLMKYDECFDELKYDAIRKEWTVRHAAGEDILRIGMFLTAKYGILVTS